METNPEMQELLRDGKVIVRDEQINMTFDQLVDYLTK